MWNTSASSPDTSAGRPRCWAPRRFAPTNQRLLDMDDGHVHFRYKNYRADSLQTPQTMTLDASEFIRRFLLHVLPSGFHRIRYYGWLGHRHRTETLARCRQLLGTAARRRSPAKLATLGLSRPLRVPHRHLVTTLSPLCGRTDDRDGVLRRAYPYPGASRHLMTRTRTRRTPSIPSRASRDSTRVPPPSSHHQSTAVQSPGRHSLIPGRLRSPVRAPVTSAPGHLPRPPRHPRRFNPHSAAPGQRFRPRRFCPPARRCPPCHIPTPLRRAARLKPSALSDPPAGRLLPSPGATAQIGHRPRLPFSKIFSSRLGRVAGWSQFGRIRVVSTALLLTVAAGGACSVPAKIGGSVSSESSHEADWRAIEALNDHDVKAALASDVEAIVSQWTDDFTVIPPVGPDSTRTVDERRFGGPGEKADAGVHPNRLCRRD